ncbi:hypothetical protein BQ8482_111858 [Mesorhizobium delmotii]|uniref:Uncharacterized protein n=1 Tax=Mesorhizobium delmotii TaxID=1631247 RepID=A0A2P9AFP3_9HYPH|nr:hypothetical protein BQ8482_111858 [Mesorhizobium delmotii]
MLCSSEVLRARAYARTGSDYFFERVWFRSDFRAHAIGQKYRYKVYHKKSLRCARGNSGSSLRRLNPTS